MSNAFLFFRIDKIFLITDGRELVDFDSMDNSKISILFLKYCFLPALAQLE